MSQHRFGMEAALGEAEQALAEGNLPIGAVIVLDGEVVARGRNGIDSHENDTHHAELFALQSVHRLLYRNKRRATVYTTLEPCMMCLGAIVNVGITRIVYGASDPWVGATALLAHGPYYAGKQIEISAGVLEDRCLDLLDLYAQRTGQRRHLARAGR